MCTSTAAPVTLFPTARVLADDNGWRCVYRWATIVIQEANTTSWSLVGCDDGLDLPAA